MEENLSMALADQIIESIKETDFFESHIFVEENELRKKLSEAIEKKINEFGEHRLTQEEFVDIVQKVHENKISETLMGLMDKGAVKMAVREDGEIVYIKDENFPL